MIRFILNATWYGCAYIDLDGCLIYRFHCPRRLALEGVSGIGWLLWWRENLKAMALIKHRLPLLYFLKYVCRVKLYVWTNRDKTMHSAVTRESLGKHIRLFSALLYYDGTKIQSRVAGPVMDDQAAYLACGKGHGLLVSQL